MKTIEKILHKMKHDGAVTAKDLAQELQLTTMGVRQHLQSLEDEGWVMFYDVKAKVGRPTRHWELTSKGNQRFANHHDGLSVQLIDSIEHTFGTEGLSQILSQREAHTFKHYQHALCHCQTINEKLNTLVELRVQEGYMAKWQSDAESYWLFENHCPIQRAAERTTVLCQSELNIFQRLFGEQYCVERIEHITQGQRRCGYRITAKR